MLEVDELAKALTESLPAPHFDVPRVTAWLKMSLAQGIGPVHCKRLIEQYGDIETVFKAPRNHLASVLNPRLADALLNVSQSVIKSAIAWASRPNNYLLTWEDERYPKQLAELEDSPPVLYCKGDITLLSKNLVAMVGSRNCSSQGETNAEQFAKALSQAGITVVSGLAAGIDAAAHKGAIAGGSKTIAVIGTGIDRIYPARHVDLAHEIANEGCIVSEFPIGTPPHAHNFPRRNRIISGLSKGVLVVEASLASGSLITARLAGEQGREVMAIPGSIHSPFSKGCHKLIKEGAALVESMLDVVELLNLPSPVRQHDELDAHIADQLSVLVSSSDVTDSSRLETLLGFDPVTLDELVERSKLPAEVIAAQLLTLELDGVVDSLPGGKYQRRAK
ncbi:MAG: DNA-processing protein DprA [Pseudomonadota bacterium]|jgi:DNA processing protein